MTARAISEREAREQSAVESRLRAIADGQTAIVAELRALRADLAAADQKHRRPRLATAVADAEFVRVVDAHVAGSAFNAAELMDHAADGDDPRRADLRRVIGDADVRSLACRLRRLVGREFGGIRLERVGRDADGTIYTFRHVHRDAGAGANANR